jgi:hypothetical protein
VLSCRLRNVLIEKVNKSHWWHVVPSDPKSYEKRGKFFASTYSQASFYGSPKDKPERVFIQNPLCGTSEKEILKKLFPANHKELSKEVADEEGGWYRRRISLDSKILKKAKQNGYDAIVLIGSGGKRGLEKNRKPNSIELNILYP